MSQLLIDPSLLKGAEQKLMREVELAFNERVKYIAENNGNYNLFFCTLDSPTYREIDGYNIPAVTLDDEAISFNVVGAEWDSVLGVTYDGKLFCEDYEGHRFFTSLDPLNISQQIALLEMIDKYL